MLDRLVDKTEPQERVGLADEQRRLVFGRRLGRWRGAALPGMQLRYFFIALRRVSHPAKLHTERRDARPQHGVTVVHLDELAVGSEPPLELPELDQLLCPLDELLCGMTLGQVANP